MIMDDPDAPNGTFTHWVVFNLPASSTGIAHGRFTVYAEPKKLPLRAGASLAAALAEIKADPISTGRLVGLFSSG
jgi:phosphatidylethanolamine-binding protein (PEBP) family uncharacterized protein